VPQRLPDADRKGALTIAFNGTKLRAFKGESIAAALYAAEQQVWGRSLKYHRPRGLFCMDGHCSSCLVRIDGVPNLRACMQTCREGTRVESQNAFPSAENDVLEAVDFLFAKGMNHHTLMTGSKILSSVTQKIVRQLSGLGQLPDKIANVVASSETKTPDLLILGGGPAGLCAAIAAAESAASVLLVDEGLQLGGSMRSDPRYGGDFVQALALRARERGVEFATQSTAIAHYRDDDDPIDPEQTIVVDSHRLLRIRPKITIHATGSYAQNAAFENNDRPGVIAMRAAGRMLLDYKIRPAQSLCLVGQSDASEALRTSLIEAGCEVHVVNQREQVIQGCEGRNGIRAASILDTVTGEVRDLPCQGIVVATTPAPASELARQQGADVVFSSRAGGFSVVTDDSGQTSEPMVFACGDVCGYAGPESAMESGKNVGLAAAATLRTAAERRET